MEAGRTLDGAPLPIDLEQLSRSTSGRADTTREVLIIFRDKVQDWISQMTAEGDPVAWREAAHTLKGSAKAIGAWPVAELCEEAESLTDAPEADRQELLNRLQAEIGRARRYIDQVIEPLAG